MPKQLQVQCNKIESPFTDGDGQQLRQRRRISLRKKEAEGKRGRPASMPVQNSVNQECSQWRIIFISSSSSEDILNQLRTKKGSVKDDSHANQLLITAPTTTTIVALDKFCSYINKITIREIGYDWFFLFGSNFKSDYAKAAVSDLV